MVKNRKGFTLVELLGAIVILGILAVFSIPVIIGLLDRSRNKMYIDDTKKLISKVEYQMRSSSNEIDIPDPGDCIIVSLVYLDDSDFDSPPNNGKYQQDYSFVVVRNKDGKLKYSATLVEKYKGSYKGVELTTSEELYSSGAIKHVKSFKKNDLLKIDKDTDKAEAKSYIKGKLGNDYFSTIDGEGKVYQIYNKAASKSDNVLTGDSFVPKFLDRKVNRKDAYNNKDASLVLKVSDLDTPLDQLVVYIGYTDEGYVETNPIPYTVDEDDFFKYDVHFNKFNYDTGGTEYLYVMVKDPDGNVAKTKIEYQIHKNQKPVINEKDTYITKRSNDIVNMPEALVKLDVSDDMDSLKALKVCFAESDTGTFPDNVCVNDNEYKTYSSTFSDSNTSEYAFNHKKRDGSTHYLKIFVRDSLGLTSSHVFEPYVFSNNTKPTFKTGYEPKITPVAIGKVNRSNKISIKFLAEDDLGDSNLKVKINDERNAEAVYDYSAGAEYVFTFDTDKEKLYDGSVKSITVTVTDREGETLTWNGTYTLYKNLEPSGSFDIVPTALPCKNLDMCSSNSSGSKEVELYINAYDDIDNSNDLYICISENKDSCIKYDKYVDEPYQFTFSGGYDGGERTVYVNIRDSYGVVKQLSKKYRVYNNKPPVISKFDVVSTKDANDVTDGGLKVLFTVSAKDDFDDIEELSFTLSEVTENGTLNNISGTNNFATYNDAETAYDISGDYDGKTRTLIAKITDKGGATATESFEYSVREDLLPSVAFVSIGSNGNVCNNPNLCLDRTGGNKEVNVEFIASDDMDNVKNLKYCLTDNENGCNDIESYVSLSDYYDEESKLFKNVPFTFSVNENNPYDGSTKTLHLYALDRSRYTNFNSTNLKGETAGQYKLYENQKPSVLQDPTIVTNSDDPGLNILDATYTSYVEDDVDTDLLKVRYCWRSTPNDGNTPFDSCTTEDPTKGEPYEEKKVLDSDFFGQTILDGKTFYITAIVTDRYGESTELEELKYTIVSNEEPIIDNFEAYYEKAADNSKITIHYYFTVFDFSDGYSICTNNEESCSAYSGTYDGKTGKDNMVDIDYANGTEIYNSIIQYENSLDTDDPLPPIEMYLFVKNSNNKEVNAVSELSQYSDCILPQEDSEEYSYTLVEGNEPITMERCGGNCYSNSTVNNNIVSYYKKKLTYKDRFKPSLTCGDEEEDAETYKANCSYKDCFKLPDSDNYARKAIGTKHIIESEDGIEDTWTVTIGNEELVCYGYYNSYMSSYSKNMESIVLTQIENEKICDTAVNMGYYNYDRNSNNPYVRVDDTDVEIEEED